MAKNRVEKYIRFRECEPARKTKRWAVENKNTNELIGWIQWHGPWRRYCFFDKEASLYDSDCLRLIVDFLEEHKNDRV